MQLLSLIASILCAALIYSAAPASPGQQQMTPEMVTEHDTNTESHTQAEIISPENIEKNSQDNLLTEETPIAGAEPASTPEGTASQDAPAETDSPVLPTDTEPTAAITKAFAKSSGKIKISWFQTQGAKAYIIYRSSRPKGQYKQIAKIGKSSFSYTDRGLTPGKTYYYKVGAMRGGNTFALSEPAEVFLLEKCQPLYVCSAGSGTLDISWKQTAKADGYFLYRQNLNTGKYEQIAEIPSGNTDIYHDTGLTAGVTYSYKIKAFAMQNSRRGFGSLSPAVSGISVGKTKISSVVCKDGSLQINWKKVAGAYRYQILRSTDPEGKYQKIATVKENCKSYTDSNVETGKNYYYKIRTVNQHQGKTGFGSSSKPGNGLPIGIPVVRYARSKNSTSVEIKWKKTTDADGYCIYRSNSKDGKYAKIADVSQKTAYTDKKLAAGQKYFYKVQAITHANGNRGYGKQSAQTSARTLAEARIHSMKLTSLTGWKLEWKKIAGANGYEITRSTKKNGSYQTVKKITSGSTLSYTDKTAKPEVRYYYKVRAVCMGKSATGYGSYSRATTADSLILGTDWKITQYGDDNGLQMVFYTIQDTHGHLIVVDGGWDDNADTVHKTIVSLGGHVHAWILTHPHQDHIGAFCQLYGTADDITIDKIYAVKMASPKLCLENAPWDSVEIYKKFLSMDIPQLQYLHTGDTLHIFKLKLEVLSAYEKKIDALSSDLINDGSMMFKIYGQEESMLFCSDVGKSISDYLKGKYAKILKSDYLQMGHHGNGGLKKDFYKIVNPDVAFFDAPARLMTDPSGIYTTPQNWIYMESLGSTVVSFSTTPNSVILK